MHVQNVSLRLPIVNFVVLHQLITVTLTHIARLVSMILLVFVAGVIHQSFMPTDKKVPNAPVSIQKVKLIHHGSVTFVIAKTVV